MLTYLILTTRALLMAAVIFGVTWGYTLNEQENYQRKLIGGFAIAGGVISAVIAYFRNATSMIDSAILNGWLYAITLVTFVIYLIFTYTPLKNSNKKWVQVVRYTCIGLMLFATISYAAPDVWGYPYHVLLSESTILSTDFLMAMIGMIFGLILAVLAFFSVEKTTRRIGKEKAGLLLLAELIFNAALRVSGLYSVLFQKKIIKSNHAMFTYTVFVKNHSDWFIYASLIMIVVVSIILWIQSFKQNEPYRNPAEHRKIKAKWRSIRRWATTVIVVCVLGVLNLTVVEAMNQTDTTLSPIEEASSVDSENVYISFDLVSDGHLHRFAYTSDDDVQIRFIVIKKPNSSSYGIGLDACDVCGETGYYEKDGQVVCNLCDVVMNISTIGFKGGCNPIVIPYEINNGQIIVPISGLLEYESEFK